MKPIVLHSAEAEDAPNTSDSAMNDAAINGDLDDIRHLPKTS
jgi:hypothetical protein